jgi:hypothetical protein
MVTINQNNLQLFWYFVCERQNVYWNRFVLKKDPPWTFDPVLSGYKFTNCYRELDRTTIWYHQNIGGYPTSRTNFPSQFKGKEKDVIFATFVHRLFNRIETMQPILPYLTLKTFNMKAVTAIIEGLRQQGQNVFTSAHLTTGVRFGGYDDKLYNIMHLIKLIHESIDEIYENIMSSNSLEELFWEVRKVQGFGPFLGYQTILDIINSGIKNFSIDSFTVAGPGCKRGIRHVFPDMPFEDALMYIRKNQHKHLKKFGLEFKFIEEFGGEKFGLHLGNVENLFCEFSKFYKAVNGIGRPRNRFIQTDNNIKVFK